MLEKRFAAVPPQAFTANGTLFGLVTLADTSMFKVKQHVVLDATSLSTTLEVKEVVSNTQLYVGPIKGSITSRTDISAYTVAAGAFIYANEQNRPNIDYSEIWRAVYDEEPTIALRTMLVDEQGDRIGPSNPLDVNATVDVTVNSVQLFSLPYDSIAATYPTPTQEIYSTYIGGLSGTLVQTATVNYTDSTKNFILNVVRTPLS
jgi:hypothetical protein